MAKVTVKVKGTAKSVKKALSQIVNESPSTEPILREADFRAKSKKA